MTIEAQLDKILTAIEIGNKLSERTLETMIRMSVSIQNAQNREVLVNDIVNAEPAPQEALAGRSATEKERAKRVRRTNAQIAADEAAKLAGAAPVVETPPVVPASTKPEIDLDEREPAPATSDDDFLDDPKPEVKPEVKSEAKPKATSADARKALQDYAARLGGDQAARDKARGLIKTVTGYGNMTEVDAAASGAAEHELYYTLAEAAKKA